MAILFRGQEKEAVRLSHLRYSATQVGVRSSHFPFFYKYKHE